MKKPDAASTAFENYEIGKKLGEGGSGVVYEANDESGGTVAIKFLKPERVTTNKKKRFKNEILFCSNCSHRNVIRVTDQGIYESEEGPAPFFVMDRYFDSIYGRTLELSAKSKLDLFIEVLNGVEAAHLKNVIHRDLKPKNILGDESLSRIVVTDFGIARFDDEEVFTAAKTKRTDILANFQYRAPEQLLGSEGICPATDIFSLGLILNELYTGVIPTGAGYRTVADVVPEYSYLDSIVDRAIQQDIGQRYASIDELKREIIKESEASITRQKLANLEGQVVNIETPDDPLIADPMKITGVNWDEGNLFLTFNHVVSVKWQNALNNMGGHSSLLGKGPERWAFYDNSGRISCSSKAEAQDLINHFNNWLPKANKVYARNEQAKLAEAEQRLRESLKAEKEAAQKKLDINSDLTF